LNTHRLKGGQKIPEFVIVEKSGGVAVGRLNRPEVFNAFLQDLIESSSSTLIKLASDETMRGIVLKGEAKAFFAPGNLD
jgi:2-(1,2-epoxy-1,2-dihydrophenyl)acetyl-CoA isomerase